MEQLGSHWTDFHEISCLSFSKICRENSSFIKIWQKKGTLHLWSYLVFLLRMKNVSSKSWENQNTYYIQLFFWKSCRLWDNVERYIVDLGRPQMTIWRMRVACWIPKTVNAHSEYVIRITFLLQQWLQGRALELRYTYIACLVTSCVRAVRPAHFILVGTITQIMFSE
jgi:hypothetical protein